MQWCMNGLSPPARPGKGFCLLRMYVRLLWDNVHVVSQHKSCLPATYHKVMVMVRLRQNIYRLLAN